jgi:hypothetical protein
MSEKRKHRRAIRGDLVICLDTGSVGIVLEEYRDRNTYLVSFPHGAYRCEREDFDILKSGVSLQCFNTLEN